MHIGLGRGHHDMASTSDKRLEKLRCELAIADEQRAAWRAFVDSYRSLRSCLCCEMTDVLSQPAEQASPLTEVLNAYASCLSAELAAVETLAATLKKLYRTLSPQQRMRADR